MTAGPQLQERAIRQFLHLTVNEQPFPHIKHEEFIDPQLYQELTQSFPTCPSSTGPTGHSLYWGDGEYRQLLETQPGWRALFDSFHSQTFIDWARDQFAPYWAELGCTIDLSNARYVSYREDRVDKERSKLRVVEHKPEELWVRLDIHQGRVGYTRAVHVDHRRRLLSMLIYFCDQQEIQMRGGELLLHDAEQRVTQRVVPQHNLMVAFPCAVNSTHSVAPIAALAAPRNYVQVHISSSVDIWDDTEERKRTAHRRNRSAKPYSFASSATAVEPKEHAAATSNDRLNLDESRAKLLGALEGATDFTVIRNAGNTGDQLIHAGMRRLLQEIPYREVNIWRFGEQRGETAILTGSGAWCEAHQHLPAYLPRIEQQFDRVIVFPTSFDTSVPVVREVLSRTRALVFAREFASYQQIRHLCRAEVAHDTAFFFDLEPYQRKGRGTLLAFRTDNEALTPAVPHGNDDIAMTCETLDEFLWTLARHDVVKTDRAHVMIAAALLGKQVHFGASNYHKVPALAASSLWQHSVSFTQDLRERLVNEFSEAGHETAASASDAHAVSPTNEFERVKALADERGRVLDELLRSKSYRLVSAYWRVRRYLSRR